ncbi:hypothetical protein DFH08DRAFT_986278 [Mycena albidolilacea]|uniref:Uncharacterized protein n=1 Tax=Mycena albidolilacea TaxID=1033008 RepID=A0AAD6Z2G5_9AGAR|nr:hypothetical protein DFH08DRAFT_986278 [Mycena albidolilacea]
MNHSLFSSTPLPAWLQPSSLAEFLDVVSAALNSDSPASPLALSLCTSSPALQRNKSLRAAVILLRQASSAMSRDVRPRPGRFFQLLLHLCVSAFLIFTAIPGRLRNALRITIRIRLITRPAPHLRGVHPSPNGAVRVVHHSCNALPFSASHSPSRLLRHGGWATPTPIPSGRSGVRVQEESYEEQDWTLALPALPSPTLADVVRRIARTDSASSRRPFLLVRSHVRSGAHRQRIPSFLVRAPTARTFPIAPAPKAKAKARTFNLVCDRRSSASRHSGATPSPRTGVEKWQPARADGKEHIP